MTDTEVSLNVLSYTENLKVVDSTGAGDTFTGILLGGLALGCRLTCRSL